MHLKSQNPHFSLNALNFSIATEPIKENLMKLELSTGKLKLT